MHPLRVGAVGPHDVGRDPLAEVGLEAVHAEVEQGPQLAAYHSRASGLVKSTIAMPACHMSICHTSPSGVRSR